MAVDDDVPMSGARILVWDIETSPNLGYVWAKWQQDVIAFESEWHLLTIAWKWLGSRKTHVIGLDDFDLYDENPEDDYELVATAHELFSLADIVIAHNGIAFDTKKAQARMLFHGFDPPTPFREVDTLRIARKHFAFTSNRLDDLCKALGIGAKAETGGFQTWLSCLQGDPKAWAKMKKYNKHDVDILEKLYLKMLPWTTGHPNVSVLDGTDGCPKCGQGPMIRQGIKHNKTTTMQQFKCNNCGGWASSRVADKTEKPSFIN